MAPDPAGGNPVLRWLGYRPGMTLIEPLRYGPICYYRALGKRVYYVNDAEMVKAILLDRRENYPKSISYRHNLTPILGNGLLVSEGDFWRQQRQLCQPAFHQQRLRRFAEVMRDCAEARVAQWRARPDPEAPLDIAAEMMSLTLDIITRTMFGTSVADRVSEIGDAMGVIQGELGRFRLRSLLDLPLWLTRPRSRAFRQAVKLLDGIVYGMIERHRTQAGGADDLVSLLLAAQDEASRAGMPDRHLRDELMTILLAGHETTAAGLAWTFYLLDRHPSVAATLTDEARRTLGGRGPVYDELSGIPYTLMVFREAMRLYPPAYVFTRMALGEDALGGYRVPAGSIIFISPYTMHRNPAYWPEPERFDPERFRTDPHGQAHRYAYLPFGGGPRTCIGAHFAQIEGHIVLATLAQAFACELVPGRAIEPQPAITLRPRGGIRVRLRPLGGMPQAVPAKPRG
jgi:cytochrome P450